MSSPMIPSVKGIYKKVKNLQPEQFLNASKEVSSSALHTLKSLYDHTKDEEVQSGQAVRFHSAASNSRSKKKRKKVGISVTEAPLAQLITESFDSGQIWEEVQLQNGLMYENLVSSISKLLAHANSLQSKAAEVVQAKNDAKAAQHAQRIPAQHSDDDRADSDEFEFEGSKKPSKKKSAKTKSYTKSVVDDKFFNLAQMTEFLEKVESQVEAEYRGEEDRQENAASDSDSDESIDMFKDLDEEDGGVDDDNFQDGGEGDQNIYYNQFFDRPLDEAESQERRPTRESEPIDSDGDEHGSDEDDEGLDEDVDDDKGQGETKMVFEPDEASSTSEDELADEEDTAPSNQPPPTLSTFEKRKQRIDASIQQMEEEAMQPKGWQYQGEITAEKRPENSLLEEHLMFDHLLRQAPEITVKSTLKLEDIMKQRIKDQAWDDVERKAKPVDTPYEYKNKLILDSEKSKQSLAQIYEQEYINKKKAEDGQNDEESVPEEEALIQKEMRTLFTKLDALSNFHFTPKPPVTDIKIVTNLPSIIMEEVAPVSVSDAALLAPQEIQAPVKGELKALAERSSTDMKRERRVKKKKQHLKRVDREERARLKGLGLRNVKLADRIISGKKGKKGEEKAVQEGNAKELKTSQAFFTKLQDKVQTQIKDKLTKSQKLETKKTPQAKRFKL